MSTITITPAQTIVDFLQSAPVQQLLNEAAAQPQHEKAGFALNALQASSLQGRNIQVPAGLHLDVKNENGQHVTAANLRTVAASLIRICGSFGGVTVCIQL